MKQILKDVLVSITPNKEDLWVVKAVQTFLKDLALELKTRKLNAKPILGGSFAKDTWLRGDYDVDVFVAFDMKYQADDLSAMLERALKRWKPMRVHGSRDYFKLKSKINFEIIPVLAIKTAKHAQNVTDFSPKHVTWVNSNGKKYKNDIRLFKQFCKAQRIYGAESYIRGFSGHVVDILVIYYKGFIPLLKAAAKWKPLEKTVLDYYKEYKGQALMHLNESKIQGPLVVVDPVQPNRNAAAAIEQKPFLGLINSAKSFLKKPGAHFFVEQKLDAKAIAAEKKRGTIVLAATTINEKEDIAGSKMVKALEFLKRELEHHDFTLKNAWWEWDKKKHALFLLTTKEKVLSAKMLRKGPPKAMEKDSKAFKKKYKNAKVVKGKLVATVKRQYRKPHDVVKHALKNDYLKDKLVSIRLL